VVIPGTDHTWATNTLVTNTQYANFLNWLQASGIAISINGRNVFYNDRPQSKIHLVDGISIINTGFENHPATHMNLIGAASFAKWLGGRLPTPEEVEKICFPNENGALKTDKTQANLGHHYPGTTPVKYFPPNELGVYDPVGNVGIWTAEKFSNRQHGNPLDYIRMCGGWSKDIEELQRDNTRKSRPWWLAASTLGLRPFFDNDSLPRLHIVLNQITELLDKLLSRNLTIEKKNQIINEYITQ
jgi:formylglycine-generating enzyme required for sulfatase activity